MKNSRSCLAIFSCMAVATPLVLADLPTLQQPWLGYFIGLKDNKFQFGVTSRGEGVFEPLKRSGEPVNIHNPIKVAFQVLETLPDGKVISRKVQWDALASEHEASKDPTEPVTFTGKVTGDASFEVTVIPGRRTVSLTGRILDKGTLKNPLTFAISTDFTPYKWADSDNRDAFNKKIKRDEIRLEAAGGGRARQNLTDPVNPSVAHADGISFAEFRIESYQIEFTVTPSENSKLVFKDSGEAPLADGFGLQWTVNEGADPAEERLSFEAK
jgi:hypothetical protein